MTEKPSVARDLARVLGASRDGPGWIDGDGLRITWCVGHLLELEEPGSYDDRWRRWSLDTLPIVPEAFRLRVRPGAEDVWKAVRTALRDPGVREVVNACDAGREGELIFRQVYAQSGCRAPVLRLWTSSLTDEAVRDAWARLQPATRYDALGDAARCRSEADWLVGMNATRALTCRSREAGGDVLWSVGRVQTPTLAMIVARDQAIAAFVPERYATLKVRVEARRGGFDATWFRRRAAAEDKPGADDEATPTERLPDLAAARALADVVAGRAGTVVEARRRTRREAPPLLYDLTTLQRRANQRYGLSAQRTLEVSQALYERHKLITYPRTDARHLTSDQVGELPGIVRGLTGLDVYRPHAEAVLAAGPIRPGKRVVDDGEVGDHHAILPTGRTPDPGRLSADEKRVYDLVARRLLAALSPDAEIELCDVVVVVPPAGPVPPSAEDPPAFRAKGRVIRQVGWMAVDPPGKSREVDLPPVDEGEPVRVADVDPAEGETKPPRPHDDASILRAMETAGRTLEESDLARALRNAGLGTPATRAAILQTLIDRGYVVRDGKALRATPVGVALVEAVPVEALKSAELTGRWEARLADVAEAREPATRFAHDVEGWVRDLVRELGAAPLSAQAASRRPPDGPPIGACPACGQPVAPVGGRYRCVACAFQLPGLVAGKKLTKATLKALLKDGRVDPLDGFTSKAGKPFTAGLRLEEGRVVLWFPDRDGARAPTVAPPVAPAVGDACPACGHGEVIRGRAALGCSRWRDGCAWRHPLPEGTR